MIEEDIKRGILADEEFISQLIKSRNPAQETHWWQSTFITSVITAILTATLTIGGGYLAQRSIKTREINQSRFEYEQNKKREVIANTWELIARTQKSNEDRISMAQGKYDSHTPAQRMAISEATNLADANWRTERDPVGSFIFLHYSSNEEILMAWLQTRSTLQNYCQCAENTYYKYQGGKAPADACKSEAAKASEAQQLLRLLMIQEYRSYLFQ